MKVIKSFFLVALMTIGFISVSQVNEEVEPTGGGTPRTESYLSS